LIDSLVNSIFFIIYRNLLFVIIHISAWWPIRSACRPKPTKIRFRHGGFRHAGPKPSGRTLDTSMRGPLG